MQRRNHIAGRLLRVATGLSVLLLIATVALWVLSTINTGKGEIVTTLATWGDPYTETARTILLTTDDISLDTSWVDRPLPADSTLTQFVYEHNWDILGFQFRQDYYTPLDGKGRPIPGVFGHSRAFSIPLKWLLLIALILPLRPLAILVWRRFTLARWRSARGLCPQCGYDLRATPDRCPECGYKVRSRGAAAA